MQRSYLDYAMSVIVGRALPDVRDGLKPGAPPRALRDVRRRLPPRPRLLKCARVVGDVMGQYHPHGDTAIYDALVRLVQPWVDALPAGRSARATSARRATTAAAALRYTECKMAPLAMEMVRDIDEDTVDFQDNYDGTHAGADDPAGALPEPAGQRLGRHRRRHGDQHPAAQPARGGRRRPVVLEHPEATREELLDALIERIKGPDFPTGALILGTKGIEDAYRTGRGSITMRAVVNVEETPGPHLPGRHRAALPGQPGQPRASRSPTWSRTARSRASPTSATRPRAAPASAW